MNRFLRDFIPGIIRASTSLACLLLLLSAVIFLSAGQASAQFGVEGGRDDRGGERMHDGGRRGTGVGIGIGVGIGEALIEKAAEDDARKKKPGAGSPGRTSGPGLTQSRRAARKGGAGKDDKGGGNAGKGGGAKKDEPKKDEARKEDDPPTLWPKDPKDGFDVPGGQVHRGTGTVTGYKDGPRHGIYCWVHLTDKEKCKKTAEYQFVTVNFEAKWGKDTTPANIDDVVKRVRQGDGGYFPTTDEGNGVRVKPDQLVGDDYAGTRHENPKTNVKMNDPNDPKGKKQIEAGPQPARKIPGGDGDTGLIDAPYWGPDTINGLLDGGLPPDNLRKQEQVSATQPAGSENAGTITVLQHFRTYVYCMEPYACLGYFEWDYNETLTIAMRWKVKGKSGDQASKMFGGNMQGSGGRTGKGQPAEEPEKKTWVPVFVVNGAPKVDGPTMGEWKPCP